MQGEKGIGVGVVFYVDFQSTDGDHKYSIKNNTVFSDGFNSVFLLDSKNSTVANNLLVSYNENAKNGNNGFNYGDLSRHDGINFENNQVIRAFDYFANQENNVDNGEEYSYTTPINNKDISNVIDGAGINPATNRNKPAYNPLIPGASSHNSEMYTQGVADNAASDDDDAVEIRDDGDNRENNGNTNNNGASDDVSHNSGDNSKAYSNSSSQINTATSSDIVSNNTDASPSDVGTQSLVGSSQSGGGSSSVSKKAYELEDLTNKEFIPSIYYVIAALILIVAGYRRKNSNFD